MRLGTSLALGSGAVDPLSVAVASLAKAAWYQPGIGVTGTLAASAWADRSGNGRNLGQASGANQPIYLPYSASTGKYGYFPGVDTCNFSTPNSATLDVTTRVSFIVRAALNDWTPADPLNVFIGRAVTAGQYAYGMIMAGSSAGTPLVYCSYNGSTLPINNACDTAAGFADGSWGWLAADLDTAVGSLKFYKATDDGTNTIPSSWTQLGSTITGLTTGIIHDSSSALRVGKDTGASGLLGKMGRAVVYNGLAPALGGAGVAIADWNADDWSETSMNGATQVSSTTGETWTLNQTGSVPTRIVASPMLVGNGTSHKMATSNFTLDQPFADILVAQPISFTAGDYLSSGTAGAAGITQRTATPNIGLDAGTGVADNANAALGAFAIIAGYFNGANSWLQVNLTAATTGDPGAGNPGGLSLFSDNAGANYGNWAVKERIVLSAPTAAQILLCQRYLARDHAITL